MKELSKHREEYERAADDIRTKMFNLLERQLFVSAVELVVDHQKVSILFLQRTFILGYNRAARLMEKLENEKIVSKAAHDGSRTVLIK